DARRSKRAGAHGTRGCVARAPDFGRRHPDAGARWKLRLDDEVPAENPISLHLDVERLGVDAKEARGLASLATGDVKGLPNGRALRLGDRRLRDRPERSARRCYQRRWCGRSLNAVRYQAPEMLGPDEA